MGKFIESVLRKINKDKRINQLTSKNVIKSGLQKFVAGERVEDVCFVVEMLNRKGILSTIDYLVESPSSKEIAKENQKVLLNLLKIIEKEGLETSISVSLTSLGIKFGEEFCYPLVEAIAKEAKKRDNFIRLNMEEYEQNDLTIKIYEKLVKKYKQYIGLTIQSYLYKSEKDVNYLQKYKANLRICKGMYKESERVAFTKKEDVISSYIKLIEVQMERNCYVSIATHDENIISFVESYVKEEKIDTKKYEFEMLYGVKEDKQKELIKKGHTVRVFVPFGREWESYVARRIVEKTENIGTKIKSIFKK